MPEAIFNVSRVASTFFLHPLCVSDWCCTFGYCIVLLTSGVGDENLRVA
jgi:hypothetical protein